MQHPHSLEGQRTQLLRCATRGQRGGRYLSEMLSLSILHPFFLFCCSRLSMSAEAGMLRLQIKTLKGAPLFVNVPAEVSERRAKHRQGRRDVKSEHAVLCLPLVLSAWIACVLQASVGALQQLLASEHGVSVSSQRLIFKGKVLKADKPLSDYGFEDGDCLHLIVKASAETTGTTATMPTTSTAEGAPAGAGAGAAAAAASQQAMPSLTPNNQIHAVPPPAFGFGPGGLMMGGIPMGMQQQPQQQQQIMFQLPLQQGAPLDLNALLSGLLGGMQQQQPQAQPQAQAQAPPAAGPGVAASAAAAAAAAPQPRPQPSVQPAPGPGSAAPAAVPGGPSVAAGAGVAAGVNINAPRKLKQTKLRPWDNANAASFRVLIASLVSSVALLFTLVFCCALP